MSARRFFSLMRHLGPDSILAAHLRAREEPGTNGDVVTDEEEAERLFRMW